MEVHKWTTKVDVSWNEVYSSEDQVRYLKLEGDSTQISRQRSERPAREENTGLTGVWRWDIATTPLLNSRFVAWIRNIGWRRVQLVPSIGNPSRQLRRRSTGADQAKHGAASIATGKYTLERVGFVTEH